MSIAEATSVRINVESDCQYDTCTQFATEMHDQLAVPRYSRGASVMQVPGSRAEWEAEHRTARKRAWRAERLGYKFAEVDFSKHSEDIHAINISLPERQGRPMTDGYTTYRPKGALSAAQTRCERHRTHTYGILSGRTLVSYMTLHRRGELAMVSMILGHGDHLDDGIMYAMWAGMVDDQSAQGGTIFYNVHSSGQDGLRFYKERVGLAPADLEWSLP